MSKRFGATQALDNVSVAVAAGDSHALVGRNGAGKSTLVAILTGLTRPDAGEIRFDGEPAPAPTQRERWRSLAACVYQKSTVIPTLTRRREPLPQRLPRAAPGFIGWRHGTARGERGARRVGARARRAPPGLDAHRRPAAARRDRTCAAAGHRASSSSTSRPHSSRPARSRGSSSTSPGCRRAGVTLPLHLAPPGGDLRDLPDRDGAARRRGSSPTSPVAETTKDELVHAMVGDGERDRSCGRAPARGGRRRPRRGSTCAG